MSARLVAGIDSSTQSTKVVVCDAATGAVLRSGRAVHPDATEVHPDRWWQALTEATGDGLLEGVEALAVGGQQHGMVVSDDAGSVIRDALLWNDTRSAPQARALVEELGGPTAWVEATGSVPGASFTVTKLRWLAEHEPDHAAAVASVELPHDWLTRRLLEGGEPVASSVTDRGEASGTGYFSPATGRYDEDRLRRSLGHVPGLPRVLGPGEAAGRTAGGMLVGPGTGDNMAAGLGLGLEPGDVVISLGTSGTVFGRHDEPVADPTGDIAGFADAEGGFLPLVCTLNAARVLVAAAQLLGVDLDELARLAGEAEPGAGGLTLLPYLDGERTPNLPAATGSLSGLTRTSMTPANLARAAHEGMLCNLAEGVDRLREAGLDAHRVLLIGGASASPLVPQITADLTGLPVVVPAAGEYVALGAARQAAWVLSGADEPPAWSVESDSTWDPRSDERHDEVRGRYRDQVALVHPETRR
ncbi:xylulokinase [Marihabitans asiaticum]|uniref:Xylulose kinase n=1 Tax=Marihabitans asiaticum TaxID=415218 RepID=A0A560WGF3_9MICO|nr:FGGY family carbohydrate kinase [Marihabitans asiaticum]TWD16761.1 xylulokinase [Marihabitans asiaticum]